MEINLKKARELDDIKKEYLNIIKSDKSLLYKKELLTRLLFKIDNILVSDESYDSMMFIKNLRKKLVVRINKTLDIIENNLTP